MGGTWFLVSGFWVYWILVYDFWFAGSWEELEGYMVVGDAHDHLPFYASYLFAASMSYTHGETTTFSELTHRNTNSDIDYFVLI